MEIKNLWPSFDSFDDISTPKEIFEQQVKFLPKSTGELVYGEIEESSALFDEPFEDFNFEFYLKSKFIEKYSFRVLSFYHPISLYPLMVRLDSDIKKELNISERYVEIKDEKELYSLLQKIFHSKKINLVVSSMMKLAK